ncbi:MAG: regulatory protein MerR [Phycisphaerales bacterium]|nr:regulatory protein MerR [Phycisphaerales bacterium]
MSHGRFQSPSLSYPRAPRVSDRVAHRDASAHVDVLGRIGPAAPTSASDWHERGVECELEGDFPAAVRFYTRALIVGGPDAQTLFDLAYALTETGDAQRAAVRYREAVQLDPTRPDAWVNLGVLLADEQQLDSAIECFEYAIELDAADPAANYNLADLLDQYGNRADAERAWRAFLALAAELPRHSAYAANRLRRLTACV